MKFRLTFKGPDALWHACNDADIDIRDMPQELCDLSHKYLYYGEIINVEFDTDSMTATVLEVTHATK